MVRSITCFILLVLLLTAPPAAAVEKLYFGDMGENKIIRCNLNGSSREELVTTGIEAIGAIAIDRYAGKMYWTDWPEVTAHIKRANLDGTNVETLLTGLGGPSGIDLDVVGGKLYWTEFSAGKIRRMNLDGTHIEDLVTTGLAHVSGIALDVAGGKMYWTDGSSTYTAKIQRANLDGTNIETLVTDPLHAPHAIDLDVADDRVYWADLGTGSYWRSHLDGTGLEEILTGVYSITPGIAVNPPEGKIYVAEHYNYSLIRKANLDGTSPQTIIASGIGAVYALALGPAEPECDAAWLDGSWLLVVAGIEPWDYSVWLTFDGAGTIPEMGAFGVPYPAGTYVVAPDCSLTGEIWMDSYAPFTGRIFSETEAEMDPGTGPLRTLKVLDPGELAGCWEGTFILEPTGAGWNVELELDADGRVTAASGFPGSVTGRILTTSDGVDDYLAGLLSIAGQNPNPDQIMFQEILTLDANRMQGTFDMDCFEGGCEGGDFDLHRCGWTGVGDLPDGSRFGLRSCPNPFNPQVRILFESKGTAPATLRVYDAGGRLVRVLLSGKALAEGPQEIVWNGRDERGRGVPSGVYFARLESGRTRATIRMTLLR